LANGISKLELALGTCVYRNDIGGFGSKRNFSEKTDASFKINGHFMRASNGHRKSKGRIKRNRLQNLYFMTMVAGIGKCSGFLSPDVGLNAYTEVGIQEKWLLKETGLEYWRIVYPLIIVPRKTVPAL
jgi:hypothetical protein